MGPSLRAWIKAGVVLNVPLLGPSSPLSGAVLGPSRPPQAPRPLLVSWCPLGPYWSHLEASGTPTILPSDGWFLGGGLLGRLREHLGTWGGLVVVLGLGASPKYVGGNHEPSSAMLIAILEVIQLPTASPPPRLGCEL